MKLIQACKKMVHVGGRVLKNFHRGQQGNLLENFGIRNL